MNDDKYEVLGGGVHQLKNRCNSLPLDLQLFALVYNKVDNPYEHTMLKNTYTKGDIKVVYNLREYYEKIANYSTITTLPEENTEYIKKALPSVTNCTSMLYSCKALTSVDTTGWDTSNVTNMNAMFATCNKLQTIDVSGWDTSRVTNMQSMFYNCNALKALDVSKWETSKVTTMNATFGGCYALTKLDVSNWDTSNVTNMTSMFYNCRLVTALDVSKWVTSKVTAMNAMFYNCKALTILDLSNWDTSKVTNMGYMFYDCTSLTTIKGVIDMKSCTSYDNMFTRCDKLTGVKIKNPPSGITATSGIGGLAAGKYTIVS